MLKILEINNNEIMENGTKANKIFKNLPKFKRLKNNEFKNLTYILIIGIIKKYIFLTPSIKKTFNHLKQTFI